MTPPIDVTLVKDGQEHWAVVNWDNVSRIEPHVFDPNAGEIPIIGQKQVEYPKGSKIVATNNTAILVRETPPELSSKVRAALSMLQVKVFNAN